MNKGYGDDNHIRTVLIDRFREMAHFEVVVAPTSRVVSSVVQDRYLNRSIRRLGASNTLLITNKSDVRFNTRKFLYNLTLHTATLQWHPEFCRSTCGRAVPANQIQSG
jgi:hypothetical protein